MRRGALVAVLWSVLVAPATASPWHSKTFTVTSEPHRVRLVRQDWRMYATTYFAENGKSFAAYSEDSAWCRDYGRYQDLRVKENACDGRVIVTLRSVGEPQQLTLKWRIYRSLVDPWRS